MQKWEWDHELEKSFPTIYHQKFIKITLNRNFGGGGHTGTSMVGVWFHQSHDCSRSLTSLELERTN